MELLPRLLQQMQKFTLTLENFSLYLASRHRRQDEVSVL